MKEVTVYYADDGTKFDTEDECYEYELAQKYKLEEVYKHLRVFDSCRKQIEITSIVDDTWINEAFWIIIYDKGGMEYLEWAKEYCGVIIPDKKDCKSYPCLFGYFNGDFINITEIYESFNEWL